MQANGKIYQDGDEDWAKDLNKQFVKKETLMCNKHEKLIEKEDFSSYLIPNDF